jgi:peptidoglycan/xylan/chitin deacetylase (PgdA/CDA1 family)
MKQFAVLMYHGVYSNAEEYAQIPTEEKPYAVSAQQFREHLQAIRDCGAQVLRHSDLQNPAALSAANNPVLITFDDGDKGWVRHALPALQEFGYQATFFVTSDLIETLPHFCSWQDIKTLADAGMNIQSHGQTHRFLADLSEHECRSEFANSRQKLQQLTGKPVTEISFPGGRFQPRDISIGQDEGFRLFHTSKAGLNTIARPSPLLKRIAIRQNTGKEQVSRLVTGHRPTIVRLILAAFAKDVMKKLLGNAVYHHLYKAVRAGS